MNRFKFRAWHRDAKEMLESRQQGYQGNVFAWLAEGQPVEIMQFTGLLDKNGKEIYEGDIVETTYKTTRPHKGEVYSQPTRLNWSVKHSGYANQDLFVYSRPDCSVEIIGNIYENPELLP